MIVSGFVSLNTISIKLVSGQCPELSMDFGEFLEKENHNEDDQTRQTRL